MPSTKQVIDPGWRRYDKLTYCAGVAKQGTLYVSGMTATDDRGHVMAEGDLVEQTRIIFERIGKVLEAAGGSFADLVKTTDYIVPEALATYRETATVQRQFLGGNAQAATGIVVHSLLKPGMLIEIDAIAILD